MTFREGLLRARGQLTFVTGLILASAVIVWADRQECVPVADIRPLSTLIAPPSDDAKRGWAYFERNYVAATGLVHAHEGSGFSSVADAGHVIKATIAAHRLGLIAGRELYDRLHRIMTTLSALPPAQAVQIDTYQGNLSAQPADGRIDTLVSALELVAWSYPANRAEATRELERWRDTAPLSTAATVASTESDVQRTASSLVRSALSQRQAD